eukprot:4059795-Pyramimonas_sp.AAC.1
MGHAVPTWREKGAPGARAAHGKSRNLAPKVQVVLAAGAAPAPAPAGGEPGGKRDEMGAGLLAQKAAGLPRGTPAI